MAGKYEKYFVKEQSPTIKSGPGPTQILLDDSLIKGSNFYWVLILPEMPAPTMAVGHPPHTHKDAELLFHIGTDPKKPGDLGGEVEFFMGPEMERYVITQTCVVYIPPGFIHAPWRPLKTSRPWVFVEVNQGLKHTEKFYPQLLTEKQRELTDWAKWKDAGY
jgi:hypothetical protein